MSTFRERARAALAWGRSLLMPTSDQLEAIGGEIGAGEVASLFVQRLIRRWLFLGTITSITFYLWVIRDPIWHHSPADSWNYFLSWLAIAIESVVGMFFFGQSLRDGGVLRRILRELVERVEQVLAQLVTLVEQLAAIAQHIVGMVEQNARMEETMIARLDAQDAKLDAITALLTAHPAQASESPSAPRAVRSSLPAVLLADQAAPRK